ncbi:MAG: antitoxin, RHH family protein [Elusimicrobia bacterium]|nr:antitoxin, RHH family protein [Elusimicrobiota bacterium]
MPTQKPRVIVTLEPSLYRQVQRLAHKNGTPLSLAVRDLIRDACADVEEWGLVRLARERLRTLRRNKLVSHQAFWKKAKA